MKMKDKRNVIFGKLPWHRLGLAVNFIDNLIRKALVSYLFE